MARFVGPLPAELLKSYEEEYRAQPKGPFLGTETLAYVGKDRLWSATTRWPMTSWGRRSWPLSSGSPAEIIHYAQRRSRSRHRPSEELDIVARV